MGTSRSCRCWPDLAALNAGLGLLTFDAKPGHASLDALFDEGQLPGSLNGAEGVVGVGAGTGATDTAAIVVLTFVRGDALTGRDVVAELELAEHAVNLEPALPIPMNFHEPFVVGRTARR